MFQRTFLRQAQAAKSVLSLRATSTTPSVIRRTSQLQPQLQSVRPFVRQPTYRFYSTENQTQNAEKTEAKENEAAGESSEESLRKELEAKQKEIVDLKVFTTVYAWWSIRCCDGIKPMFTVLIC
jgi:molecular chaperone GrpE